MSCYVEYLIRLSTLSLPVSYHYIQRECKTCEIRGWLGTLKMTSLAYVCSGKILSIRTKEIFVLICKMSIYNTHGNIICIRTAIDMM